MQQAMSILSTRLKTDDLNAFFYHLLNLGLKTMRTDKTGLVAFTTLLMIVSISLAAIPVAFTAPQVLAQTVNERKAEAL